MLRYRLLSPYKTGADLRYKVYSISVPIFRTERVQYRRVRAIHQTRSPLWNWFAAPSRAPAPGHPEFIAGTLAYMAPEQTGRTNRSIDSRSDLYALGVTLYEMLTGSLPFSASDSMEWVHCHIARQPVPPDARSKNVPALVSGIVMNLLAKTAKERYQTAGSVVLTSSISGSIAFAGTSIYSATKACGHFPRQDLGGRVSPTRCAGECLEPRTD